MEYDVRMSGKFNKIIRQMPANARKTLYCLLNDIKETGPVQPAYHKGKSPEAPSSSVS